MRTGEPSPSQQERVSSCPAPARHPSGPRPPSSRSFPGPASIESRPPSPNRSSAELPPRITSAPRTAAHRPTLALPPSGVPEGGDPIRAVSAPNHDPQATRGGSYVKEHTVVAAGRVHDHLRVARTGSDVHGDHIGSPAGPDLDEPPLARRGPDRDLDVVPATSRTDLAVPIAASGLDRDIVGSRTRRDGALVGNDRIILGTAFCPATILVGVLAMDRARKPDRSPTTGRSCSWSPRLRSRSPIRKYGSRVA